MIVSGGVFVDAAWCSRYADVLAWLVDSELGAPLPDGMAEILVELRTVGDRPTPVPGERDRLVDFALRVADDLEANGHHAANIVRRLAREIATSGGESPPGACPQCGNPVVQIGRGRPKKFCSTRCRQQAATKSRRNDALAS